MQQGPLDRTTPSAEPPAHGSPDAGGGLSPWLWGFGLVAIVGVLWYVFGR